MIEYRGLGFTVIGRVEEVALFHNATASWKVSSGSVLCLLQCQQLLVERQGGEGGSAKSTTEPTPKDLEEFRAMKETLSN